MINELNVQRKELDKIRIDLNKKESLFIKKENALQEKIKILDLDKQEILDKYLFEQKKELEKFKKEIKTIKQSVKTSSGIKEAKKKLKKLKPILSLMKPTYKNMNTKLAILCKLRIFQNCKS